MAEHGKGWMVGKKVGMREESEGSDGWMQTIKAFPRTPLSRAVGLTASFLANSPLAQHTCLTHLVIPAMQTYTVYIGQFYTSILDAKIVVFLGCVKCKPGR